MLSRFAALAAALLLALTTAPAHADDDWIAKAIRSGSGDFVAFADTAKPKRLTSKRRTWKSATRTVAKQTFRAARSDDARPSLQQRTAAPVTAGGEYGIASYYWQPQPVASGGRFNPEAMTAAHKTLPFGTRVRVTRADNGRSVEVTINDRGPFVAGRIIDLSRRAARDIGMTDVGITRVRVAVLGR